MRLSGAAVIVIVVHEVTHGNHLTGRECLPDPLDHENEVGIRGDVDIFCQKFQVLREDLQRLNLIRRLDIAQVDVREANLTERPEHFLCSKVHLGVLCLYELVNFSLNDSIMQHSRPIGPGRLVGVSRPFGGLRGIEVDYVFPGEQRPAWGQCQRPATTPSTHFL